MEIKIFVPLNREQDLKRFIETCESKGFKVTQQGGGILPNFSGYYAILKGDMWDTIDEIERLKTDVQEQLIANSDLLVDNDRLQTEAEEKTLIAYDLERENQKLRESLELLVKLKEIKDGQGKTPYYQSMIPKAWSKAKEALKGGSDE